MRWKKPSRADAKQFTLDWNDTAPPKTESPMPMSEQQGSVPSVSVAPSNPAKTFTVDDAAVSGAADDQQVAEAKTVRPVQFLPWDFRTSFPLPLPDAIDAGIVAEEDAEPENLAALHQAHAQQMLDVLSSIDTVGEARRRGVDPATGKSPRSHAKKVELPKNLGQEMLRLQRWWKTLWETYEAAFGTEAADAFDKSLRARHAGIEVAIDSNAKGGPQSPAAVIVAKTLPSPRPVAHVVAAGVFGLDENGAVSPSQDEVDDITKNHAELLIDLLDTLRGADRNATDNMSQRITQQVDEAVQKYAEDFGQEAADQLLAYARRQVILNDSHTLGSGLHR